MTGQNSDRHAKLTEHDSGRKLRPLLRAMAIAALMWERFWPLAIPALCVVLVFMSISWIGVWPWLPDLARFGLVALFAVALGYALLQLRELRWPDRQEISRRIETASHLDDRPVIAQHDSMAMGESDAFAGALWREHRKRMAERLDSLISGTPAPDANRKDPWAARAFLAVIAFATLGFSYGSNGGGVMDAIRPPVDAQEVLSRLDIWISPPAYTRKPPLYLSGRQANAQQDTVLAPQGSELTLRYVGNGTISAQFVSDNGTAQIQPGNDDNQSLMKTASVNDDMRALELSHALEATGTLLVQAQGRTVAEWPVEIVPDQPPVIAFVEEPSSALSGSLQLSYSVEDDYGVAVAEAEITSLDERDPQAKPLFEPPQIGLSLPRKRARSGSSKVNRDLSSHPWAGGNVAITLVARDDAGQSGRSESHEMVLPGRRFSDPLARALIEQRRILALDARKAPHVANLLDAVLTVPEEFIDNLTAYTAMKIAWRRIATATNDDSLRSAADLLWDIALAIEFGDMSDAERRLREAQEQLSEALENGAEDEEIARLMDELREAMNEFMRQLAEEAMQNPQAQNPFGMNEMTRMLSQRDLERMMDQIEDLARSGSRDAARQLLSEMQRMMDNLRAGRHMQQRQSEGNQMNQALDKLSELMQRQQELMDETFRMQQQNPENREGENQQGQQGQQDGGEQMTPEEFAQALKRLQEGQESLRQQLQELGEELEGMGLDPSREFGEAGREMGEAGENLGQGNTGGAATDQGQALEALRQGAQSMMQQMAGDRQQGGQQVGRGQNGGPDRQRPDPLGRQRQDQGVEESFGTRLPDEIDAQRAREIMEAIRERLARPSSPLIERKYLERLLESE
jgi:uncharacterized protein (TIGR02302 family)